jgi:hypothetical protein
MLVQGIAMCHSFFVVVFLSISIVSGLLGFGTALVYQLFLSIAGATNPFKEQKALVFLDYGDLGYAIGAIISQELQPIYLE